MSQNFMPDFIAKGKTEAAPTAAPAAPAAAPADEVKKEKKARKPRDPNKPRAKEMTAEDIAFIRDNVKGMSYTEIANARGLTKHQVNRALMDIKKGLREQFAEDTPQRAAVEKFIEENLTRPADTRPGAGGGRGGAVKESINDVIGNILGGLGLKK